MIRMASTFLALAALALADSHGGAIPSGLSFYESTEFADVQLATGRDSSPVWGTLVLEGADGVKFVPDTGASTLVPYPSITALRYERIVKSKDKTKDGKWFQKPLAFARGVDTYRVLTIEHRDGDARRTSLLRVDEQSAHGIQRMLEIKTGLRVKKLSGL